MYVTGCVREREKASVCVCVRERERERERACSMHHPSLTSLVILQVKLSTKT